MMCIHPIIGVEQMCFCILIRFSLKILASSKTSLNVLHAVFVVDQQGHVWEGQDDLAAVAVVGPAICLSGAGGDRGEGAGTPCA